MNAISNYKSNMAYIQKFISEKASKLSTTVRLGISTIGNTVFASNLTLLSKTVYHTYSPFTINIASFGVPESEHTLLERIHSHFKTILGTHPIDISHNDKASSALPTFTYKTKDGLITFPILKDIQKRFSDYGYYFNYNIIKPIDRNENKTYETFLQAFCEVFHDELNEIAKNNPLLKASINRNIGAILTTVLKHACIDGLTLDLLLANSDKIYINKKNPLYNDAIILLSPQQALTCIYFKMGEDGLLEISYHSIDKVTYDNLQEKRAGIQITPFEFTSKIKIVLNLNSCDFIHAKSLKGEIINKEAVDPEYDILNSFPYNEEDEPGYVFVDY